MLEYLVIFVWLHCWEETIRISILSYSIKIIRSASCVARSKQMYSLKTDNWISWLFKSDNCCCCYCDSENDNTKLSTGTRSHIITVHILKHQKIDQLKWKRSQSVIVDENDSEKNMLCHKSVNSEQHIISSDLIFKSLILDADSDLCALILELIDTLSLVRDENIKENVNIHSSKSSSSMLSHDSADSIMTEIEQDTTVIFDAVTSSEMNLNVFIIRNKTTMYKLSSLSKLIISIKDMKKHVKLKTATVSNKMQQSKLISSSI